MWFTFCCFKNSESKGGGVWMFIEVYAPILRSDGDNLWVELGDIRGFVGEIYGASEGCQ